MTSPSWRESPSPDGSELSRRCEFEPPSGHDPQYNQLPLDVVPSSFSQAKPGSCCPAFGLWALLVIMRINQALPLISLATSVNEGLFGLVYAHDALRIASGNLPPSFWYSSRTLRNMRARISWSNLASPGVGTAAHFHCSQRAELTNVPSFSAKPAQGRR